MSLYSMIGIAVMAATLAAGTVIKLVLQKRREELDGCQGIVHKKEVDVDEAEWEDLE